MISYQNRITISIITITIFTLMEEIYLLKIGPDFIGWSVIRGNDYEKYNVVSIMKKQNKELKTA